MYHLTFSYSVATLPPATGRTEIRSEAIDYRDGATDRTGQLVYNAGDDRTDGLQYRAETEAPNGVPMHHDLQEVYVG